MEIGIIIIQTQHIIFLWLIIIDKLLPIANLVSVEINSFSGLSFYKLNGEWINSTRYGWKFPEGFVKSTAPKPTILGGSMYFTYDTAGKRFNCHCVQYWIYGYFSGWGYSSEKNNDSYNLRSILDVSQPVQIGVEENYFYYIFNIDTSGI